MSRAAPVPEPPAGCPAHRAEPGSLPPGPADSPARQALRWNIRPDELLDACVESLGDIFTLQLPPRPVVMVGRPDDVRHAFAADPDVLRAGEGNAFFGAVMGERSLLRLDGNEHLHARRRLLATLNAARVNDRGEEIRAITETDVRSWPHDEPFSALDRMRAISLEIILAILFGRSDDGRVAAMREAASALMTEVQRHRGIPAAVHHGTETRTPIGEAIDALERALRSEVDRRRTEPAATPGSVLDHLLAARDRDGNPLSEAQIRDDLVTLVLAGHETTATALAWAVERLVRHPEALERLTAEARAQDGSEYAKAVVLETLRVRPPVWLVTRHVAEPFPIRDWVLPAGSVIAPCMYLAHNREDGFEDPQDFRPERFLGVTPGTYQWIPFGGGRRRCIGAVFAQVEMVEVLHTVLRLGDFVPTTAPGEGVRRTATVLAPRDGAKATFRHRSGRPTATADHVANPATATATAAAATELEQPPR
jgi:cytochrome P450